MTTPAGASVEVAAHGTTTTGEEVRLFTIRNARGHVVTLSEYGAMIVDLLVPDRDGKLGDVCLGYASLGGYFSKGNPYFGAIVGRVGNRIANGRFALDGHTYQLACNNGENHLHGGLKGFDKKVWWGEVTDSGAVRFKLVSPDGDEGYPGTLSVEVTYAWSDASALTIDFRTTTDKATPVNLTNHAYFNLSGNHGGTILDTVLRIPASRYVPVSEKLIPTGRLDHVAGTPFDFRERHEIGERLAAVGGDPVGYDFTYVLDETTGLRLAAEAVHPASGRRMRVFTTEPGVQLYTGNFLNGSERGKTGATYPQYGGFCLETQHFPDSPNQPSFPSVILRPGEVRESRTVFEFGLEN